MMKLINLIYSMNWFFMFLMITLILIKLTHPIFLMILMIFFNLLICLIMSFWMNNFMYSILMFLIMISGLFIIFMYFSSLISNDEFNFKFNKKLLMIFLFNLILVMLLLMKKKLFYNDYMNFIFMEINNMNLIFFNKCNNIMYFYYYPMNNFTLINMFYILFVFFIIIKINLFLYSFSMRKLNLN